MSQSDIDISTFLTAARLEAICPSADPDIVETILTDAPNSFPGAGLTTATSICHFLSQIAAETGGLGRLDENLYYTTPSHLIAVYGKNKFPDIATAKKYIKSPKKLANYVYAGVNGNTLPDDGYTYRGSGLIQLTGRGNFAAVGKLVGMPLEDDPDLCRQPDSALEIALGYWRLNKISGVATDTTDAPVEAVTRPINPKLLGLSERRSYFRKALSVLVPPKPVPKRTERLRADLESIMGGEAAVAEHVVAAEVPVPASLSGAHWVALFPTSRSLDDLKEPFRAAATAFVDALRRGGATVRISATFRPAERAYLMHWAWQIARKAVAPFAVPAMAGVPIQWDHGTLAKSRKAAQDMVNGYGIVHRPALKSRHTDALAIDMTIAWSGALAIRQKNGTTLTIGTQPRNGSNSHLIKVGSDYGVIKLVSDPPHWSVDGK
ncbi:MAG: hypothetical protein K2X71_01760 [Methylobacterium sp.]|uniref:glycoside hydrolase family 19 protein n=1 Tax=Methylobacterium sp. TaxID=409 RepID=UPI0025884ED4|nr:hypothetical protein [Methylobacterium sp.]MBY0294752.1 hypothetical protein [Methylobacterium sp.]